VGSDGVLGAELKAKKDRTEWVRGHYPSAWHPWSAEDPESSKRG